MQLQSVKIKNFKGIKEKDIIFKPGFNLIKGANGTGKTSILEAVAVGLGGFIAGLPDVTTRHFSSDEVRTVYMKTGDGSYNKTNVMPLEVSIDAILEGKEFKWTRGKSSINASRSTTQPRDICKMAEKMAEDSSTEFPVLVYLSASRVWSQRREKTENIFRKQYFRTVGYTDALIDASNVKLLMNWCMKMEMVAWQKEKKIAEYEAVKQAVAKFMDIMEESDGHEVFYDKQEEQLMYKVDDAILPIMQLSAGYQSLVWMAFDIAYRMAVLNPDKKEHITETKGVVLIDEIDMHLHPRWQWNIVNALKTVFPNVQFIAATHSPILFAASNDLWLIDVEEEEVQYTKSRCGYDANAVLEIFMGAKSQNEETEKLIHAIYVSIRNKQYEIAEEKIQELVNITSENYSEVVAARMELKRSQYL
ncbi:MAG: AAA family ATPase [Thermoflexaceae bacterium]|nr:AAA family ATPase [Thermoflexaceae bacterium]